MPSSIWRPPQKPPPLSSPSMGGILRLRCDNLLKIFLATAALVAGLGATAFARDASLEYSISNSGRYCEFQVGDKIAANAALRRTFREYVESSNYNVVRIYGACQNRI